MRASGQTDIGKVRSVNQDTYKILPDNNIYIVADGMGGHAAGDKASQLAVKTISEILLQYNPETETLSPEDEEERSISIEEVLRFALESANEQILLASMGNQHLQGMGTTAIIALVHGGTLYLGHIGDSRTYLIRNEQIQQVSEDHSVVQQLVKAGAITADEAESHPYKNVITKCLGMQNKIEPDTLVFPLEEGDRFLMCSDGLSNMVTNEVILEEIKRSSDPEPTCQSLIDLANDGGGTDNITVVLLYND